MKSPLLYLAGRSLVNRLRTLGRRAKSPRYLVVYLLALGYLWLVLLGPHPTAQAGPEAALRHVDLIAVLMTALALRWWLMEDDRSALAFTPAELTFLFPAPLTRSQLIRFKLLRVQFFLLINTLFWTIAARRTGLGVAPDILRAIALWVAFGTLFLHRLAAALSRGSMLAHGRTGRGVVGWVLLGGLGLAPVLFLVQRWSVLGLAWRMGPRSFGYALTGLLDQPIVSALLWPMRLLFRPTVAEDVSAWAGQMLPAVGLLLLHFFWVVRADFAFEEAALAASSRSAGRLASGGKKPTPLFRRSLPLGRRSGPIVAVAWKNLLCQMRAISLPTMLALGIPFCSALIFGVMEPTDSLREVLGWFALFWALFLVLIGPQWVRYDLRKDLPKMDLLRSYPISGAAVMTGEIAASALILSGYQVLLLTLALGGLWRVTESGINPQLLGVSYLAALILVLPVNWMMVAIYNGGALLFPEWVRRGRRGGGIEGMGQSVMGLGSAALLLSLLLLVPAAIGWLVAHLLTEPLGSGAILPGAILATFVLLVEGRLLSAWLGARFDRYDPSTVRLSTSS